MGMWDGLGQQLTTRQRMEQDLAGIEDTQLNDAYAELQKRRGQRNQPGVSFGMMNSPGANDYFRRQGNDSDAAFLKSYLTRGERPQVRVGEAAVYGGTESHGPVKAGPFAAQKGQFGVTGGPFKSSHARAAVEPDALPAPNDAADLRQLLQEFRLRQQGLQ